MRIDYVPRLCDHLYISELIQSKDPKEITINKGSLAVT